jgi:glycosyltransferase involved in cell wall biosynthesis
VCFVGDDASPPWSHASAVLAKRLIECLSPSVECVLATLQHPSQDGSEASRGDFKTLFARSTGNRSLDTVSLVRVSRECSPDIVHLVGTNALIFSPMYRALRRQGRILRHVFTSYDRGDALVHPFRRFVNRLFISGYAFTSSRIGQWSKDLAEDTPKFLIRPPIDCASYRPVTTSNGTLFADRSFDHSILYMGPLWDSRFPARTVLTALKRANENGLRARLAVLTSKSRSSSAQGEKVSAIGRELDLRDSFVLRRVDLSEQERVQAYCEADLVIFPYRGSRPEKLADPPFGLLEAMACEGLVLATSVLSIPEIVDDGETGFLMSNSTVEEIQKGMERSLTHIQRGNIRKNARTSILRTFSYPAVREKCLKTYDSLLQ